MNKLNNCFSVIGLMAAMVCMLLSGNQAAGQSFNYGVQIGVGSFNEKWNSEFFGFTEWKEAKSGLILKGFGELNHGSLFSTRLEIGFLKKGYNTDHVFEHEGVTYNLPNFSYSYNTLTVGLSEKITFLDSKLQPYIKAGINFQYVLEPGYKNRSIFIVSPTGELFPIGGSGPFDGLGWNYGTLHGNLAIGILFNRWLFLEIDYNQGLTKALDKTIMQITERYFGITLGVNINQLY
ncbi:MAG: PorT family protein [Bacteroidetes bacterium]|nr:PorT family protein [Bacteroidota bacterium]MBU1580549.1 PorT family protein [Bacteroidota bacterium]MBU2557199.1 PorT family protein [Bacteroidota bacterium]